MQFQIPQFIEVEDKIFGPLTLKQFLFLAGGAAAVFLLYASLPLFLVIFLAPPVGLFSVALAFYKIHGQPFVKVTENALRHYTKNKIYTWKKIEKTITKTKEEIAPRNIATVAYVPKLTKSKLNELAWSLDIKKRNPETK
ncbi:MAG: PrgI family protein [bacterium]|nr:PrgI family protein [bacterium]